MKFSEEAIDSLKRAGVGVMPSDTVYGLSCLALNKVAVERIYKLKGRNHNKKLIILLATIEQVKLLGLKTQDLELVRKFWPAPLTVVIQARQTTPEFLHRGTNKLPLRIPSSKELRELMEKVGPIVSTSANLEGQPTARNIVEARKYFGDKVDFYVDAGTLDGPPSTIAEVKDSKLVVTRQGAFRLPTKT